MLLSIPGKQVLVTQDCGKTTTTLLSYFAKSQPNARVEKSNFERTLILPADSVGAELKSLRH